MTSLLDYEVFYFISGPHFFIVFPHAYAWRFRGLKKRAIPELPEWPEARLSELVLVLEQGQNLLRCGVRLRQGRDAGLQLDLRFGQVGRFRGHVRVPNAGFGGG